MKYSFKKILSLLCILGTALSSQAQDILLDKPVRAGDLTVFQELGNPNNYYYLPDKLRLARHPDGTPQLSFLQYVENTQGPEATDEAEGGGIVHAVIELVVTNEQLNQARQRLRRINPTGVIVGPIVYRGGTMALITSFNKENGELTKQVIGLGKAPVLDNQKAAVSIQLTKKGSKLLWASFKTPTPDLSFSFEMELSGYRSPIRAKIEADFDQLYETQSFQAAVAAPILAAEIKATFDEMIKKGAIKVTQVGSDADMEKAVDAAYTKLTNMMFDPVGGTGTPGLGQLTSLTNPAQPNLLDRATTMLNASRTEARSENERRRLEAERRAAANNARPATPPTTNTPPATTPPATTPPATGTPPATTSTGGPSTGTTDGFHASEGVRAVPSAEASRIEAANTPAANTAETAPVTVPSLAITASYELRKVRQKGTFTIDLNKFNADNLVIRFDENVGTINCDSCFKQINLSDPVFTQRPVTAFLDGFNALDFASYINGVTVTMRKRHAQGDITTKEVRIDRNNFTQQANNFKMVYGWKNDQDRSKWLDYEFKTDWFFFGGYNVTSDWQTSDATDIKLTAPLVRRLIDVEADPTIVNASNIRAIDIKVFSTLGTKVQSKEMRMVTRTNQLSGQIEIIQPKDTNDYQYEVTWHLNDGSTRSSGRKTGTSKSLFVDHL